MSIAEKYEKLSNETAHRSRAKHLRLGRLVDVYRVEELAENSTNTRKIVSQLSKLDHPLIPHLIDFVEDENGAHIVVEAVDGTTPPVLAPGKGLIAEDSAVEDSFSQLLDRLSLAEQAADAMCHASGRDVAHGNFSATSICMDDQGVIRLAGLGMRQLFSPSATFHELQKADLRSLKDLVKVGLEEFAASPSEADSGHDGQRKSVQKLRKRIAKPEDDVCRFSKYIRTWLHRELALREAQKLAVSDVEVERESNGRGTSTPLIAACAAISLLLLGLVIYLLSPRSEPSLVTDGQSRRVQAAAGESISETTEFPVPNVTSDLRNVGTLNNSDAEPPVTPATNNTAEQPPAEGPEAPNEEGENKETLLINSEGTSMPAGDKPVVDEPQPDLAKRKSSPFETLAVAIDLPSNDSTDSLQLFETDLADDEPLQLTLCPCEGSARQPTFEMAEDEDRWNVVMQRKSESTEVAKLLRVGGGISFQWLDAAAQLPQANQLRNSVLKIKSGDWNHDVVLRRPILRPLVTFDLERNRPYNLDIDYVPDEIFLEYVPSKNSVAIASPQQISWRDAVMTIGLDAGKDSLVIVQVKPVPRAKLRIKGLARPTADSARLPIKKGFGRSLRNGMMAMNKSLYTLKNAVKTIKGKDAAAKKKQAQLVIKQMEEKKKLAEVFLEAYLAARATNLHLRVLCVSGGRNVILADYGGQVGGEPAVE